MSFPIEHALAELRDTVGDLPLTIDTEVMTADGTQVQITWHARGQKHVVLAPNLGEAVRKVTEMESQATSASQAPLFNGG